MKDHHDQYDRNYYESVLFRSASNSQRNQKGLNELLKFKQEGKLLEIGCGKGEFLKLASQFFNVTGMDVSRYATRYAAADVISRVRYGDVEAEDLSKDEYNAIVAFNVLEHLQNPHLVLAKIFQGLRNQGVLIGSVPLKYGIIGRIYTRITNIVDRTHISTYQPTRWKALFQDTGFSQIQLFGEVPIGKNRNVYVRHRHWPHLSLNLMFVCVK
jgi:2-polyprenyl-3-methyl-5-hydroxy-6-metoxy-1,4-benzoquinol methylase